MKVFSHIICCVPAVPAGIAIADIACQKGVVLMYTICAPQTSVKAREKQVYFYYLVVDKINGCDYYRFLKVFNSYFEPNRFYLSAQWYGLGLCSCRCTRIHRSGPLSLDRRG